jgi:hypothetical protein
MRSHPVCDGRSNPGWKQSPGVHKICYPLRNAAPSPRHAELPGCDGLKQAHSSGGATDARRSNAHPTPGFGFLPSRRRLMCLVYVAPHPHHPDKLERHCRRIMPAQLPVQTNADSALLLKKLEEDHRASVANNIRESQRQSTMHLGSFYYDRGDFMTASKYFMRSRERCASNQDVADFCVAIVRTYAQMGNWPMVATYVNKYESTATAPHRPRPFTATRPLPDGPPTDPHADARLGQMPAVVGLGDMVTGRYRSAASHFARVGPSLNGGLSDVVSGVDVARYGTLCSLAACERRWIRTELLGKPAFAMHLESLVEVRPQALPVSDFLGRF